MAKVLQELQKVQHSVKDARRAYRQHNKRSECLQLDVVNDCLNGGAHINGTKKCEQYHIGKTCDNKNCEHYAWKAKNEELYQNLLELIEIRNDFLIKYFWIFKKYRQFKIYKQANKFVIQKRREYWNSAGADFCDAGGEDAIKQSLQSTYEAYRNAMLQRNEARAEFFGRNK